VEGSQVTIALTELPNSTLVSVDKIGDEFTLVKLGSQETIEVNSTNFYNIPNLAMFIDAYDIQETIYQDGYLDLYYGSGTSIEGETIIRKDITMVPANKYVKDYSSDINNNNPISWKAIYDFTDQFLTTYPILVEGEVLYHQLFDLDIDANDSSTMNSIIPHHEKFITFGLKLPEELDVSAIKAVGKPYSYALSVQGYPIGKYKSEYCRIETTYSGNFAPSEGDEILTVGEDYDLAFDENYTAYVVFYKPISELSGRFLGDYRVCRR